MTLDEAIQHCKEVYIEYEAKGDCYERGKEHRQLAEWAQCEVTHWMTLPEPPKSK